jgi:predicted phage-related endonuclease
MIYTNHITGVNVYDMEQGTEEWLRHRAGVITASRAHDIIKSGRSKGSYSEARDTYMLELIAQVCTGLVPESASFKQAEWGHENEPLTREAYEALEFVSVNQCGLIYRDESLRCAISPDGILEDRGLEIKNPFTSQVHIATLLDGAIKPEYVTQCQYSMWVSGLERWDFCSYDHRMRGEASNRLCVIPQYRDQEFMDKFDAEIPKFISEMDEKLSALGFAFGDQWR